MPFDNTTQGPMHRYVVFKQVWQKPLAHLDFKCIQINMNRRTCVVLMLNNSNVLRWLIYSASLFNIVQL